MKNVFSLTEDKRKPLYVFFYIFAFFITALLFFIPVSFESQMSKELNNIQWYYDTACTIVADPCKPQYNDNNSAIMYTFLQSEIPQGYSLWFRAKNGDVCAKIDGISRYQSPNINEIYGKSPGTYWVNIPLDTGDAGKLVEITLTSPYGNYGCYFDESVVGDSIKIFREAFLNRMVGVITCLFLMIVGLCLILAHLILSRAKIDTSELFYLGFFAFSTALWSFSESKVMQLFTDETGKMHNLSCMSLMLIVLPLFMYFKSDLDKKNRLIVPIISWLSIGNFVSCTILHFGGIMDFHETLSVTHAVLATGAAGVVYANYLRYFSSHKKSLTNIFTEFSMIFIGAAAIIDIIRYRSGAVNDSSVFTRIGLTLYVIALAIDSLTYVVNMVQKGLKTDLISRLAYEDGLTSLGNRTAYQEYLIKMENTPLTFFMFDINNLKQVNDIIGHEAGDSLIIASADAIRTVFSNAGKCFRIGGDEFVVIAKGRIDAQGILNEFQKYVDSINQSQNYSFMIRIAVGYSYYSGNGSMEKAINIADKYMYKKKAMLKSQNSAIFNPTFSMTVSSAE